MKLLSILTAAAVSALALQSCDKDDDNNPSNSTNNGGTTFKVRMTDAPGNYAGMNVQITKVEAFIDTAWVSLNSTNQAVNVLELTNGSEHVLAYDNTAQTGHYTKLRITMGTDNTLDVNDESGSHTYDLDFGLGVSNEVIISIDKQVNAGSQSSVLLDFNVAGSVSEVLGSYWMDPDMSWIQNESTGVKGDMNGASQGVITFTGNGNTYTSYLGTDGKFMIRGMQSGTYAMSLQGMHDGENTMDDMQMSNIVVSEGQITNMGSITFN